MKRTLLRVRAALDAAGRPDALLYGEGWDYGEIYNGRLGPNGSQLGMAGSGVGTFNDRLREGAIGGGPFSDPRLQGLLTGLGTQPGPAGSGAEQGDAADQAAALQRCGVEGGAAWEAERAALAADEEAAAAWVARLGGGGGRYDASDCRAGLMSRQGV